MDKLTPQETAREHNRGRSGCRRYRTYAPLDAKGRHALVDPFDGRGDGLFAHYHPQDLDSFRFAAPSFANIQAFQRSAVRRQGPRHCWSLSIAAQSRAGAQRRREESDTSSRSRAAGLTDDARHSRTPDPFLCPPRHNIAFCGPRRCVRICDRQMLQAPPSRRVPRFS